MKNLDSTHDFKPQFNSDGLIPAIAQDYKTKEILMFAWMNETTLNKTIETGEVHYWSRSRQEIWHKGTTSGTIQIVKEIRTDCDQDVILMIIEQKKKGACHTGRSSCFYRKIDNQTLVFDEDVF